jgi:hypothetical protein
MIDTVADQIFECMELEVPIDGTRVFFPEGKFKKFFAVRTETKPGISALITEEGLTGFRIQLFKAVPKPRMRDGSLRWYDPEWPVEGRVFCRVDGE